MGLALLSWFKHACDEHLEGVTKLILLEKALSIGAEQGLPNGDLAKINVGWVKRWKKFYSISQKKIVGVAGAITMDMAMNGITKFCQTF